MAGQSISPAIHMPPIMFSIMVIATGVLIIDLIYPLFDPRVRYR